MRKAIDYLIASITAILIFVCLSFVCLWDLLKSVLKVFVFLFILLIITPIIIILFIFSPTLAAFMANIFSKVLDFIDKENNDSYSYDNKDIII